MVGEVHRDGDQLKHELGVVDVDGAVLPHAGVVQVIQVDPVPGHGGGQGVIEVVMCSFLIITSLHLLITFL